MARESVVSKLNLHRSMSEEKARYRTETEAVDRPVLTV